MFEHEPNIPPSLRKMKNVVITPHLGSAVQEVRERMANIVVDNIAALIAGGTPPNCVNPEVLRRMSWLSLMTGGAGGITGAGERR